MMKKLLFFGLLLIATGAHAKINFDIWNKTSQPLYFELGTETNPPSGNKLIKLGASGAQSGSVQERAKSAGTFFGKKIIGMKASSDAPYYQNTIDTSQKTVILLSKTAVLPTGEQAVLVTINQPNKDIFIRIKPDTNGNVSFAGDTQKYLVGPQTGPLLGFGKKTERGLPLDNNITQADIRIDQ